MSVSVESSPWYGSESNWVGRLCLRYVNRVQESGADLFQELWVELPVPAGPSPPPPLVIRRMSEAGGVPELLKMYNAAYVGAPDYRPAGWIEGLALQTAREFDPSLIWIGLWHDRPVGFCMARKRQQMGRIGGIGVKPEWRRQGIGAALLHHALTELAARGATRAHLSAATCGPGCQRIYRRNGFHE